MLPNGAMEAAGVLSVKKLGGSGGQSASEAADYYEQEVTKRQAKQPGQAARRTDDYLSADETGAAARWWSPEGKLVRDGAPLRPGELRTLLEGRALDSRALVQSAARGDRVCGWDMT